MSCVHVQAFEVLGLRVAPGGEPYCRECGRLGRWTDAIDRGGELWGAGFECLCGWAIEMPVIERARVVSLS